MKKHLLFGALSALLLTACQQDSNQPSQTPADLKKVSTHRSGENISRDAFRHPIQTLDFFGIKADDKVIEILPGSGWYTEILAPKLNDKGTLIAAHYPITEGDKSYRSNSRLGFEDKLKSNPEIYGKITVVNFDVTDEKPNPLTMQADAVLTFRSLHGFEKADQLHNAFKQFNLMLKQGGTLGVVQHQAPMDSDPKVVAKQGYLPISHVIYSAEKAGFSLVTASGINENPKDTIVKDNIEGGVWTLPPSSSGDHSDHYKHVGESNRMTLKFIKN